LSEVGTPRSLRQGAPPLPANLSPGDNAQDEPHSAGIAKRFSAMAPFDGWPRCNVAVAIGGEPDMQIVVRGGHIGADAE
jgi:hypothetical protein